MAAELRFESGDLLLQKLVRSCQSIRGRPCIDQLALGSFHLFEQLVATCRQPVTSTTSIREPFEQRRSKSLKLTRLLELPDREVLQPCVVVLELHCAAKRLDGGPGIPGEDGAGRIGRERRLPLVGVSQDDQRSVRHPCNLVQRSSVQTLAERHDIGGSIACTEPKVPW